ncbi:MAG: hypothetical protein GY822_12760 [Deltaproteobacteria bacterium]|nr:hypothetical protein [Deltaproteobacteria bacterium]
MFIKESSLEKTLVVQNSRRQVRQLSTSWRGLGILLVAFLWLPPGGALAASPKVNGLELVPWSKKIEENRYKSGRNYRATLKYFRKKFSHSKRHRWHAEVNVPSVKYKFLENLSKKRKWDGINIYELANGTVMMFVLPHREAKKEVEKRTP